MMVTELRGAQTGWCWSGELISWSTPPRPLLSKEAVAIFLGVAATPPQLRRGKHNDTFSHPTRLKNLSQSAFRAIRLWISNRWTSRSLAGNLLALLNMD